MRAGFGYCHSAVTRDEQKRCSSSNLALRFYWKIQSVCHEGVPGVVGPGMRPAYSLLAIIRFRPTFLYVC